MIDIVGKSHSVGDMWIDFVAQDAFAQESLAKGAWRPLSKLLMSIELVEIGIDAGNLLRK
jgi:hypothetical protein